MLCQKTDKDNMTKEYDHLPFLSNQLGRVSTSEHQLFREEGVKGKGVGCIASQAMKRGELVLREFPQLFLPDDLAGTNLVQQTKSILKAFSVMSKEDQARYMRLYNIYSADCTKWSDKMRIDFQDIMGAMRQISFQSFSFEKAVRIWTIFRTNAFHKGVCLRMSRFNHSCRPNAQHFWNGDTKTRDLRALRRIKEGEELTVSYSGGLDLISRKERRARMKEAFNFECQCEACNLTKTEIQDESKTFQRYNKLKLKMAKIQGTVDLAFQSGETINVQDMMKVQAISLKKMFTLVKKIKTADKRIVL